MRSILIRLANQYQTSADFPNDYPYSPPSRSPSTSTPSASAPGRQAVNGESNENGTTDVKGRGKEVWSRGGSCIINPLGEVLAGPLWDQEGILYAEVS